MGNGKAGAAVAQALSGGRPCGDSGGKFLQLLDPSAEYGMAVPQVRRHSAQRRLPSALPAATDAAVG